MKRIVAIIFLNLLFVTSSQATDIRDFQIEGISIGDNLIDYMSQKEIINNDEGHYPKDSKFFEVNYIGKKNKYDYLLFHVKRKDNNYKIYYIRAANIVDGKSECLKIKKDIVKELKELFDDFIFREGSQKHYFYKNSTQYISQFSVKPDANRSDHVRAECMIVDDKDLKIHNHLKHTLELIISTEEFSRWLINR